MYQSILVVLDEKDAEQTALLRALHFAHISPVKLTLFVSIYDFAYEMTTILSGDEREQMRTSLLEANRSWVKQLIAEHDTQGLNIEIAVVWHHRPFEAIIRCVLEQHHDLIIKSARQHSLLQSVIFTPTDWHLLRKAPCQVLLVKEQKLDNSSSVLAAVHAATESSVHKDLNKKIIQSAAKMSEFLDTDLQLINCYPLAPATIAVEIPEFDTSQYQVTVRAFHEKELNQLIDQTQVHIDQIHLVEGMAEEEIPRQAKAIHAGLVVLGTVGRTGISAALLGNTAEHVIGQLNCDLLALKPDGFKCPLTL